MKEMLVVEDNPSIARVIEQIGLSVGYQITVAHSLKEVEQILENKRDFYVATIDYSLPDAYEGQAISYILNHDIPSIVVTGRINNKIHAELLNLPIIDYITKENAQAYHYLQRVLLGQLHNHKIGVAVVDDSLSVRSYVANLLERRNFTVHPTCDGKKALQLIKDHPEIKLVITDYDMPGMSGIELTQALRRFFSDRELIIIGYSALEHPYQSARFIKSGADDYMHKPFCPEEFYCRIFRNIENLQLIERLKRDSTHDMLTQLPLKKELMDRIDQRLGQSETDLSYSALVVFHIDNLESVNQQYGFEAADKLLIHFAHLLEKEFSQNGPARLHAGMFAVLLDCEGTGEARKRISRLLETAQKSPADTGSATLPLQVSMGWIEVHDQDNAEACLNEAHRKLPAPVSA